MHPFISRALLLAAVALAGCGDDTADSSDGSGTGAGSGTSGGEPDATTGTPTTGPAPTTGTTGDQDGGTGSGGDSHTGSSTTTTTTTGEQEIDCADGIAWARHFAAEVHSTFFEDMVADADGNLITVGRFVDHVDFGGGVVAGANAPQGFVAKYGPTGELLWIRQYGDFDEQRITGVAVDLGGHIVVTGEFRGSIDFGGGSLVSEGQTDGFVARLTADGEHVWSRSFGGPKNDRGVRVAADEAGDVVMIGTAAHPLDFGFGVRGASYSTHVVKFKAAGGALWHRSFDSEDPVHARDVAIDPSGDIVVVGELGAPVDFGAGLVADKAGANVYVVKLSPDGDLMWVIQNDGTPFGMKPFVTGVDTDDAGDIHLGGWFSGLFSFGGPLMGSTGQYDAWIAELSATGELLWSSSHGGGKSNWQFVSAVAANGAGETAVSGNFSHEITLGAQTFSTAPSTAYDAWVARLAANGEVTLARRFGGLGTHHSDTVEIGEDGSIWLAGIFDWSLPVGDDEFVADLKDAYLIRLCPDGA